MRKFHTITLVILLMMMLASCAQPAAPTAQVIIQTQIVEKEAVKELTAMPERSDGLPVYTGVPAKILHGLVGQR